MYTSSGIRCTYLEIKDMVSK